MSATYDAEWDVADAEGGLARYLQTFLERIGLSCTAYTTLDGRNLVKYQAAFTRNDWYRACAALDAGAWRGHSAAYRSKYGVRIAPKIKICNKPRFRDQLAYAQIRLVPAADYTHLDQLPVMNTVFHYTQRSGPAQTNSNPSLDISVHSGSSRCEAYQ